MPSFFSKLFSSSSSSTPKATKTTSRFDRLISSVNKSAQYQPDIYDDLRGDGFFFRPSDTIRPSTSTTTLVSAHSQSVPFATVEGSKSTPNLVRPAVQEQPFELATLTTPALHSATSDKDTIDARDSAIELPALPPVLGPNVHSLPARIQASASTPNLLAARTYDPEIEAHRRAAALALSSNAPTFTIRKSSALTSASTLSLPLQTLPIRQHAPSRPSPLALATPVSSAVELPARITTLQSRRNTEDFPIMLSPSTAASLSPPIFSFSPEQRPISLIRRKPVPSLLLHTAVVELPATPVMREVSPIEMPDTDRAVQMAELPAGLDVSPVEDEVEMTLPILPAHLSRLQTLRQRISVMGPVRSSADLGGIKLVSIKRKRGITSPSILTLDDMAAVEALATTSSSDSQAQAGAPPESTTRVNSGDYEFDEDVEDEDDEVIEIGTARVVMGVNGLEREGTAKRVVRESMVMNRGKLYLREGLRWWAQKL
jgi:hypothetical protein